VVTVVELLPLRTPTWTALASGVEVTSWPLADTGGVILTATAREAAAYAEALGGRLTTAAEEDELWSAASVRLLPLTATWPAWPDREAQSARVLRELGPVSESALIAGTGKVWTSDPAASGHACNYGWHVPGSAATWRGVPTFACVTPIAARVLQPRASAHNLDHSDYSQQVRVARVVTTVGTTPPEYRHPLYRPLEVTRITTPEAADALLGAVQVVTGRTPDVAGLAVLVGHSALETGNWGKGFKNWNWGNSKSSLEWPHTYFRTGENVVGRTVMYDPPHVSRDPEHVRQTRFRAFATAHEGAVHHLRLLTGGSYRAAYAAALQGDVAGFCRLLYRPTPTSTYGYYTGATADPVAHYTAGLRARMQDIDAAGLAARALDG
jgi:hypothetical protein